MNERERLRYHRRLIAGWVERNGKVCPGFRRKPHRSSDLTIDHIVPKSKGGTDAIGNLRVLCRSCNSRKHDKRDDPKIFGPAFRHPLV